MTGKLAHKGANLHICLPLRKGGVFMAMYNTIIVFSEHTTSKLLQTHNTPGLEYVEWVEAGQSTEAGNELAVERQKY